MCKWFVLTAVKCAASTLKRLFSMLLHPQHLFQCLLDLACKMVCLREDEGVASIITALKYNRTLEALMLVMTGIGDRFAQLFVDAIESNPNSALKRLSVSRNYLRSDCKRLLGSLREERPEIKIKI